MDIASLYSQGVGAPAEQSDFSEDTATAASDRLERLYICIIDNVTLPKITVPGFFNSFKLFLYNLKYSSSLQFC